MRRIPLTPHNPRARLIAIGGGGFAQGTDPALEAFVLHHAAGAATRIGYIATANGFAGADQSNGAVFGFCPRRCRCFAGGQGRRRPQRQGLPHGAQVGRKLAAGEVQAQQTQVWKVRQGSQGFQVSVKLVFLEYRDAYS
jgi:hypothetical protein